MILNKDDESKVVYSDVSMRHLAQICNLLILYPSENHYVFDNDVKGSFRNSKYHPDTVGVFIFSFSRYLMIHMIQALGYVDNP